MHKWHGRVLLKRNTFALAVHRAGTKVVVVAVASHIPSQAGSFHTLFESRSKTVDSQTVDLAPGPRSLLLLLCGRGSGRARRVMKSGVTSPREDGIRKPKTAVLQISSHHILSSTYDSVLSPTIRHRSSGGVLLCSSTNTGARRNPCCKHRLAGHDFCRWHILEDPTAPYRRCDWAARGKRCKKPVPLAADDSR